MTLRSNWHLYILLPPWTPTLIINYPPKCIPFYTSCPLTRALGEAVRSCLTNRPCLEQLNGLENGESSPYVHFAVLMKTHCRLQEQVPFHSHVPVGGQGAGKRHRGVDSQQIMWEMTVEARVLSRLLQGCVSHKENSVNARAGVNSTPLGNYQQLK